MKHNCSICLDKGVVQTATGFRPCSCVVEANLKKYVGPQYMQFNLNRELDHTKLKQNLYFSNKSRDVFGDIVKSFLVKLYLKENRPEWMSINGSDIIEDWLADGSHTYYYSVPFLIIKLGNDYSNKQLGPMLSNVLQRRLENNRLFTWIYVLPGIKQEDLVQDYGIEVTYLLDDKNNFKKVK